MSLMQMAKTSAILTRLSDRQLPFISILTDPTMGGVSASFAFLGDVVIGEPGALIGFAGPRVIEQTVRETLPEGFQRAEFLLEKGAIDMIVGPLELISELSKIISLSFRLFGNIFAGGILIAVMLFLVGTGLPIIFYALELIVGLAQAGVFAVLTLVFTSQAMQGHHGDDEHEEHAAEHH